MNKEPLPAYVPAAVQTVFGDLSDRKESLKGEKACRKRLVCDPRMKAIYTHVKLVDAGWRSFFGAAWLSACLPFKELRDSRRNTYKSLTAIAVTSRKLAGQLNSLKLDGSYISELPGIDGPLRPFLHTVDLLDLAGKDDTAYADAVRPILQDLQREIHDAFPSPFRLLLVMANRANEVKDLRRSKGAALRPWEPAIAAGMKGNKHSRLREFREAFEQFCNERDELKPARKLSPGLLAELAAVALNDDSITADQVKAQRSRNRNK